MHNIRDFAATVGTLILLTACSALPAKQGEGREFEKQPYTEEPAAQKIVPVIAEIEDCDQNSLPFMTRTVHFDFDSFIVREDGRDIVQSNAARVIRENRSVLIQGNTDERGSSEYNLALGHKRAEAVRKAMAALGVPEGRMEAISLGEEKPVRDGHDEEAWSQNRRADIVYKAK